MPARKAPTDASAAAETFEQAFAKLEAIVEAMESDSLPLEDLVKHYEQGTDCLNRCEAILNVARERIQLITLRNRGEISLDAGGAAAETDPTSASSDLPDDSDQDDIRLF